MRRIATLGTLLIIESILQVFAVLTDVGNHEERLERREYLIKAEYFGQARSVREVTRTEPARRIFLLSPS